MQLVNGTCLITEDVVKHEEFYQNMLLIKIWLQFLEIPWY